MNLTDLTPKQIIEVLGLVHYAENSSGVPKDKTKEMLSDCKETLDKLEWIDEMYNRYLEAIDSEEDYIEGVSFESFILRIERDRQIDAKEMHNEHRQNTLSQS